ncbi:MAG TPA: type II secretion system protein GspC [Polyangia bacterium]|jgi:general secretion pathway protein C
METLLRKYLWVIDLLVIAVSAVFAARATGVTIETAVGRNIPTVPALRRASTEGQPTTRYDKDVDSILKRNIFCSTCPPILAEPEDTDPGVPPTPTPVRTSLPLKLMAIMFSPPPNDPRWSVAVIRDTEKNSAGPYAIGGTVHDATIVDIQETRIYLDDAGKPEFLDLLDPPPAPPAAAAAAPPPAPSTDPFVAEMDKGIKKTGENSFEIQRGTVDSMLGNMALLSRSARIVPEVRDGKSAGFRLFSVRADGPFGKIGLQNGDVIYAINGLEMTSPDNALMIYTKLKAANHISVALERNGTKLTKDYNIR